MRYYNSSSSSSFVFLSAGGSSSVIIGGILPFSRTGVAPPSQWGHCGCWMSGVMVEAELVGAAALWWLSVVNKQRQVPESLDGADLGSRAPGM